MEKPPRLASVVTQRSPSSEKSWDQVACFSLAGFYHHSPLLKILPVSHCHSRVRRGYRVRWPKGRPGVEGGVGAVEKLVRAAALRRGGAQVAWAGLSQTQEAEDPTPGNTFQMFLGLCPLQSISESLTTPI